ncbi:hypothetical protein [uncultured Megasphaera sp.]|uniref:hypothetical protein n=1 Tax=uncultured Megasphaera sp. TaxID=165188 RepID=UPI0025D062AA|nr:hypothetical protein [uncultured Megasphaera sp.]
MNAIGPFLMQENKRKNLSVTPAQAAENSGGILAIDRFSLGGKGYAGISGTESSAAALGTPAVNISFA